MPKYVLAKAILLLNGVTYNLQVDKMYNPWFGDGPNKESVSLRKSGESYKLSAVFSDGAGSYLVEWKIIGKTAIRSTLSADEDTIIAYYEKPRSIKNFKGQK